jgi:thiamine biosynthesis lipoprotein
MHRFAGTAMASPLRLVVAGALDEDVAAGRAWSAVCQTFEAAEQALSRFRDDSDLTRLNRQAGQPAAVGSRLLVRALVAADRAHRRTDGRFDPRVLADLERLGYPGAPLGGARPAPAARVVSRTGRRGPQRLAAPVDLGGIGKGLALRWAARAATSALAAVLAAGGGFLIDAGQDLVTRGDGPDGGPFLVDIEDPSGVAESLAVVRMPTGGAVATSSIRLRRWTAPDGRRVHHLIDPRTGEPGGDGLSAVTVAGADPAWAEVWSKALFLEGASGIAFLARREGLAAWWVTTTGELEMTPAARVLTAWLPSGR